jgi:hypothetical protein
MKKLFIMLLISASICVAEPGGGAPALITKEADLVVLTLKPDAETRLRIQTVVPERKTVSGARLFSGEVVTPLAAEGKTVAPFLGGTLDEVLRLADLQAAADGRVQQAQLQIDAAKISVERAQKMLIAEAGSVRGVDEAKTVLALAESSMATARTQRDLLGTPVGQGGPRRAWVRVAIYSGEAALLDARANVCIRISGSAVLHTAKPVAGPPTANGLLHTVDWYYDLPAQTTLRAGERVTVEVPLSQPQGESCVIPFKAVLHDIHGGQWVYLKIREHAYARRRIQVVRVAENEAVLFGDLPDGAKVVTDGSAELSAPSS